MAIKIWLSFIRLVLLIVFFARTGIIAIRQQARARLVPRRWLRQLMMERPAFAILEATRPPQLPHAPRACRLALARNRARILGICWETNGSMHPALLKQAAELSLNSGGCIKFDPKAWSKELHIALCGVSNEQTFESFRLLADYMRKCPSPRFLVAGTLLVPGYIDKAEVAGIVSFICSLSPDIPPMLFSPFTSNLG